MPIPRIPLDKIYVESHPYISFVNKRHVLTGEHRPVEYPLHRGLFFYGSYTTNSMRFVNGPNGKRDIVIPKPDILVLFALQIVDTQPDVVVIYHAYNDIRAYITPGFESDYSHVRRNLGESNWKLAILGKIPHVPLKFLNFLIHKWLPDNPNSLLGHLSKGDVDLTLDPSLGLRTYQRNLQHIIDLCRGNGIQVVLSTYCHFLYDAIKDEPLHQLYGWIVEQENEIVRRLADKNELVLVDNAMLVPDDERYFVDSVHFTPEGMAMIAGNIAEAVQKLALSAR